MTAAPGGARGRPLNFTVRGHGVKYSDGQAVCVGDAVTIDRTHQGTVVACIEEGRYLPPHSEEQGGHLRRGVMIDTTFGGLIHYPDQKALETERWTLARRKP